MAASARAHRDAAQAAESAQEERRKSALSQSAAEKHVRALAGLEEERDHYLAEAQALARRVDELMEEVRSKSNIMEFLKFMML